MDPLEERLTDLWHRQAKPSLPPDSELEDSHDRMGVTVTEPMKISGTVLMPGHYVLRLPGPDVKPGQVEIFNEDETRLIATITCGGLQFPTGLLGPAPSSRKTPRK
jgi:hypothetical protein